MATTGVQTVRAPRAHASARGIRTRDAVLMGALAVVLLGVFLYPAILRGYPFPLGPDVPVYLWWSRLAMAEGVAAVGARPGAPVLIPTIGGALGLGLVPALAGLQYALGPAIGLAGAGLLRGRGAVRRPAWLAGGFLAGVWATHLGDGYVANLLFVAPFLAAAAALAHRTRRGTIAAAILLGGGGLAHPQFFLIGGLVLVVAAGWAAITERRFGAQTDAGRTLAALLGGGGLLLAGWLATLAGPSRLGGDTSKDAFLRRTGEWGALRETYLDRAARSWRRYAPFMTAPLLVAGAASSRGFARRFLVGWLVVTAVGVPLGVATTWYPPDRMLTFAFCIPLLTALGLVWLGRRLGGGRLAWAAGLLLVTLIALPALRTWDDQRAFIGPEELEATTLAGRIGATTPPGTPLVFVVNDPDATTLFTASHALNLARAAVPPNRVRDVAVYVGTTERLLAGEPTVRGDTRYDLASRTSLAALPGGPRAVFVIPDYDRDAGALDDPMLTRWSEHLASTVPDPRPLPAAAGELAPSDTTEMVVATLGTFLLLAIAGLGWARWTFGGWPAALAAAPAFGVAVLTLTALATERLGMGLGSFAQAATASLLGGAGGYGLAFLGAGRRGIRPGSERRIDAEA